MGLNCFKSFFFIHDHWVQVSTADSLALLTHPRWTGSSKTLSVVFMFTDWYLNPSLSSVFSYQSILLLEYLFHTFCFLFHITSDSSNLVSFQKIFSSLYVDSPYFFFLSFLRFLSLSFWIYEKLTVFQNNADKGCWCLLFP